MKQKTRNHGAARGKRRRILIVDGSHRNGNTAILVQHAVLYLRAQHAGVTVDVLTLRDIEMQLPDGCDMCAQAEVCPNMHDAFSQTIEPSIRSYDAYILATPSYDDGVTPLLKIFWDRIVSWSHDERKYLAGKAVAVMIHGMSGELSFEHGIRWVRSVCVWEHARFAGAFTCESGAHAGALAFDEQTLRTFLTSVTSVA